MWVRVTCSPVSFNFRHSLHGKPDLFLQRQPRASTLSMSQQLLVYKKAREKSRFFLFFRFIRFYAKREIQGCRVVHFSYISLFFDVFQLFRAPSRFRCDASRCGFLPYEQKEKNVHSCKHDSRSFLFVRMALNSYRMSE